MKKPLPAVQSVMPSRLRRRLAATIASTTAKGIKISRHAARLAGVKLQKQPNWYAPFKSKDVFLEALAAKAAKGEVVSIRAVHENVLHRNILRSAVRGRLTALGFEINDFNVRVVSLGRELVIRLTKSDDAIVTVPDKWKAQRRNFERVP